MGDLKRGVSSVIGALIFICIVFTCIVPMWVTKQQADLIYDKAVADMQQFDIDRANEDLSLSTLNNILRLKNTGSISVNVVRVWFNDDPRNVSLILPMFGQGELNPNLPDGTYDVMVVTERGRIFTTELNIYKPGKFYVSDTWDDDKPHWFATGQSGGQLENVVIQKGSPTADHKRAVESSATFPGYYGWYWAQDKICGGKIELDAYLGSYRKPEYDYTRRSVAIIIAGTTRFDNATPPNIPYLILTWRGDVEGWNSESCNNHIAGTITLGAMDPFNFALPGPVVTHYRLDLLEGKTVHVFIGYSDSWNLGNSQWGSAREDSWIHLDAEVLEDG